jgi:hypothetical protein
MHETGDAVVTYPPSGMIFLRSASSRPGQPQSSGCLYSAPRDLSGFLPGRVECGAGATVLCRRADRV